MNRQRQRRSGMPGDARRWCVGLLAVTLLGLATPSQVVIADDEAIEAGRAALKRTGWYPWYDSRADDVRRIRVQPPRQPLAWSGWDLFTGGDWFTPLAWVGIITILGLIVFFLVRTYLSRERRNADRDTEAALETVADEVARVEQLPVRVRRPASDWLQAARDQYLAGNYSEAIIFLYSHLLLQLDRRNLIRLTRGKTNRQYLREVGRWASLRGLLESAMVSFEDVFFGERQLERERFESVWKRLDQFDMLVEQAAASQESI